VIKTRNIFLLFSFFDIVCHKRLATAAARTTRCKTLVPQTFSHSSPPFPPFTYNCLSLNSVVFRPAPCPLPFPLFLFVSHSCHPFFIYGTRFGATQFTWHLLLLLLLLSVLIIHIDWHLWNFTNWHFLPLGWFWLSPFCANFVHTFFSFDLFFLTPWLCLLSLLLLLLLLPHSPNYIATNWQFVSHVKAAFCVVADSKKSVIKIKTKVYKVYCEVRKKHWANLIQNKYYNERFAFLI